MGKKYIYKTVITIGETNILGNMYFLNFFKMQGVCRELFVKDAVEDGLKTIEQGVVLITKNAYCDFLKSFNLFENVLVKLSAYNLKNASTYLRFEFFEEESMELRGAGSQHIVFSNSDGSICRIPQNFRDAFLLHLDDDVKKSA